MKLSTYLTRNDQELSRLLIDRRVEGSTWIYSAKLETGLGRDSKVQLQMLTNNSRAPKQIGDFGEGLATYALIRQGFEVAHVDHVGADLIAQKGEIRLAISVKTRTFKEGSTESRGTSISFDHVAKIRHFSARFGLISAIAVVACCVDDKKVHLFQATLDNFEHVTNKVKNGFYLNFAGSHLEALIESPGIDYCCWDEAAIGPGIF